MKTKYTKKQIQESIKYWEKVLESMENSSFDCDNFLKELDKDPGFNELAQQFIVDKDPSDLNFFPSCDTKFDTKFTDIDHILYCIFNSVDDANEGIFSGDLIYSYVELITKIASYALKGVTSSKVRDKIESFKHDIERYCSADNTESYEVLKPDWKSIFDRKCVSDLTKVYLFFCKKFNADSIS